MDIFSVRSIVAPYGYEVSHPSKQVWAEFMQDMDEGDKYEASKTWRYDWVAEMEATYTDSTSLFSIYHPTHDGVAMYGLTEINPHLARIWLLQSKKFSKASKNYFGRHWVNKGVPMARKIVDTSLTRYKTVFNFVPKTRIESVRFIKSVGFSFFDHPTRMSEMLFFGRGASVDRYGSHPGFWEDFIGDL
ncbi:MAG: hypothetical protein AAF183_16670 [Pseudomonadota bacterium]